MFQLEIVEGEPVFACNICDEGFDEYKNIADAHEDIMNYILTIVVDEGEGHSEEIEQKLNLKWKWKTQEACTMEMVSGYSNVISPINVSNQWMI